MEPEKIEDIIYKEKFISTFEFFSQIIDSLHDYAILTMDTELRINSWNIGSTKLFGYEAEEVIGQSSEIIFPEEERLQEDLKIKIKTAIHEGRVSDSRFHIRKDGSRFYGYGVIFPLIGKDGELLGFVKILKDLTEKRKSDEAASKYLKELEDLNTRLEDLNTHKDSILAILSHDLRSPMATIVGIAHYLKTELANMEQEDIVRMVDILHKASSDELDMLDYLLEWARIKYASEAFKPTKIDLHQKVNKVFDTLQASATIKSIQLQNEIAPNTHIFGDRKMVLSIVQNLVSNAIQHSSEGGAITVAARGVDRMIHVQVKDTGRGMSPQIQEQLFTPQLKKLSKIREEDKGGGIGLLLVKGFIEKHGGEISVDSVKGKGTSFYFTLPREKPMKKTDRGNTMELEESE